MTAKPWGQSLSLYIYIYIYIAQFPQRKQVFTNIYKE